MGNTTNINNAPIGVIDSGIGGITVLRELLRTCPTEHFIYIGDDANSPYGTREKQEIQQLSLALANHPMFEGIKALLVACNTITAAALDSIKESLSVPVIGVIDGGVTETLNATTNLKVGILATTATVESGIFETALHAANADVEVTSVGAPKMHEYAENNLDLVMNNPTHEIKQCVADYMQPFIDAGCDTILMACTHFPPYEKLIDEIVGPDVNIVSPSKNTAEILRTMLDSQAIASSQNSGFEIITTAGNDEKYAKFSELILR